MANRQRTELDTAFDDWMDAQAWLIQARTAITQMAVWHGRAVQAVEELDKHQKAQIGHLEYSRHAVG